MNNILISGAGIAGLSAAYWLKEYGFNPTIVEKHPNLRAEGYKLDIRGAAIEIIKKMGLQRAIFEARTDIRKALFVNDSGTVVTETTPDLCGVRSDGDLEIVRGDLCQILYKHMGEVECIFDDAIVNIEEGHEGVNVTFDKHPQRKFDLVIGADGLHSRVRKLAFGEESEFLRKLGLYISFYSIPNYLNLDRVEIEYHGLKRFAIAYCPQDGMAKAGFAFPAAGPEPLDQDQQKQCLQNAFTGAGWEIPHFLELMHNAPDFYFAAIAQIRMPKWTTGRIALVGDAGYAVSPLAGQGASVALVGAYLLAGELAESRDDHTKAFTRYEENLRDFVQQNQQLAQMSLELMTGGLPSRAEKAKTWLQQKLVRMLPNSVTCRIIQFYKEKGLRQTATAANAITLKDYRF